MANYIFIAKNTVPFANPAGLVIYRIAKALSDLNHDVKIFSLDNPNGEQRIPEWLTEGDNVTVESIDISRGNKLSIYLKFIWCLIIYIKTVFKSKEQLYIVTHTNPLYCHWFGFVCKILFRSRVKWIASFTDPYVRSPFTGYARVTIGTMIRYCEQKIAFALAGKLIFVTNAMRDYICGNDKKAILKSTVIPFFYLSNWSEKIKRREYLSHSDERLVIMHAGSIYGNRDVSKFLASLNDYKSTILFKNFGRINSKNEYLADNVVINAPLPYEDVIFKLKDADYVLIIDSFFESMKNPYMPSKVVDAMYLMKPIIGITEKNSELDHFLTETGNISLTNDKQAISNLLGTLSHSNKVMDYHKFSDKHLNKKFTELEF